MEPRALSRCSTPRGGPGPGVASAPWLRSSGTCAMPNICSTRVSFGHANSSELPSCRGSNILTFPRELPSGARAARRGSTVACSEPAHPQNSGVGVPILVPATNVLAVEVVPAGQRAGEQPAGEEAGSGRPGPERLEAQSTRPSVERIAAISPGISLRTSLALTKATGRSSGVGEGFTAHTSELLKL